MGPCASIEEQLACVFFDDVKVLCTAHCGSVEEFLQQSRKVAYEPFGINTVCIAVRKRRYLRGFAYRFIELCAPELKADTIKAQVH